MSAGNWQCSAYLAVCISVSRYQHTSSAGCIRYSVYVCMCLLYYKCKWPLQCNVSGVYWQCTSSACLPTHMSPPCSHHNIFQMYHCKTQAKSVSLSGLPLLVAGVNGQPTTTAPPLTCWTSVACLICLKGRLLWRLTSQHSCTTMASMSVTAVVVMQQGGRGT